MKAYLVVGPESSGNRYLTRLLCQCGCEGAGSTIQPFDVGTTGSFSVPEPRPEKIAVIRSFPYAKQWLRLDDLITNLENLKYDVTILVMTRDPSIVEQSQIRTGHVKTNEEARLNIARAYRNIFYGLIVSRCPYLLIPYEQLSRPEFVEWLLTRLDLEPVDSLEPFANGNTKYQKLIPIT